MSITDERLKELIAKYQLGAGYASECAPNDQVGVTTAGEANLMFVDVAAALDELLSLRRSQWRPIAEAPRDETAIIGWQPNWSMGYEVQWCGDKRNGGWYLANNDPSDSWGPGALTDLTHWMPLPSPPMKDSV
jgi:hypothetical protein